MNAIEAPHFGINILNAILELEYTYFFIIILYVLCCFSQYLCFRIYINLSFLLKEWTLLFVNIIVFEFYVCETSVFVKNSILLHKAKLYYNLSI